MFPSILETLFTQNVRKINSYNLIDFNPSLLKINIYFRLLFTFSDKEGLFLVTTTQACLLKPMKIHKYACASVLSE